MRQLSVGSGGPQRALPRRSGSGSSQGSTTADEEELELLALCNRIDADGNGSISKLELIAAVHRDPEAARLVAPDMDPRSLLQNEESFDAVNSTFDAIAGGKQRIKYSDFVAHFRKEAAQKTENTHEMRSVFRLIDADGNGSVSKLELVAAVQQHPVVAAFVLPGLPSGAHVLGDEGAFDAVNAAFEAIASGKSRISLKDFEDHFRKVVIMQPLMRPSTDRSNTRVLVIGPGFGRELNPRQGAMLLQAGFQVHWVSTVPNPELPNFPVLPYLGQIKAEIDAFQPDVVACASKGGIYVVGLWQMGLWRGPTLLINAHPSCGRLPEDANVVLAQGSNDEVYPAGRAELEQLVATGGGNRCFLYYTANSGHLPSGQVTRVGDRHMMESLLQYDCLPRLVDAACCPEGPEVHMLRTWRERLGDERLEAEAWLGYTPGLLRRRWASPSRKGLDEQKLFEVPWGSEEFRRVVAVFKAAPREPPAYLLAPQAMWDRVPVVRVQRVENGLQGDGCSKPYFDALRRSLHEQGVGLEPGTHTCWAFHGADAGALESIVSNPVAGFQPLASGTRNASVWGSGTYFAREAKYVADGGFCGQPARDGTRRMLMCLLMTGVPCLGDPQHKGVLPFRQRPHRYNSSVDSLSSPEIHVVQHPGAAQPAYLITFGSP